MVATNMGPRSRRWLLARPPPLQSVAQHGLPGVLEELDLPLMPRRGGRVGKVPRLRRFPIRGLMETECRRYSPDGSFRMMDALTTRLAPRRYPEPRRGSGWP